MKNDWMNWLANKQISFSDAENNSQFEISKMILFGKFFFVVFDFKLRLLLHKKKLESWF